ncbi:MAG: recombinase family protein, partial [Ferrovum sp.]|nr:recombinase family protein [Ferrovum sp.]
QFNTTTSMGRLMLNVLLSFDQFEREGTGERIRDKIAAAKRKGMWMGGVPPLGYDVDNRLLIINEAEAAVVRRIFEEMLTIGSPTQIAAYLTAEGITTKVWTTQEGQTRPGARIDKKYLHKLLRNRIYLGELSHKGNWYPGVHPAIITPDLWGRVHEVLSRDGHVRSVETKTRSRTDALLRGLLYSPSGERMYPTYSRKDGRKYHYYVSRSESRFGASGKTYERLPALEIEAAIVAQIRTVLTSPESVASVVRHIQRHGAQIDEASTVIAMGRIDKVWDQLFSVERHRIANLMIERIDLVRAGEVQGIKVKWRELGWKDLIGEFMPDSIGTELIEMEGMA